MKTVYYIDGISASRLEKIANAVDEKIKAGAEEFNLKNGETILIFREGNRYLITDDDLNTIEETYSRYEMAMTVLQLSK